MFQSRVEGRDIRCKRGQDDEHICKCKWGTDAIYDTDNNLKYITGKCIWDGIQDPEFTIFCANLFGNYQNGFLPFEGGLLAQPHWYMQMIGCMSANKNRIEKMKQEQEEAKRKK